MNFQRNKVNVVIEKMRQSKHLSSIKPLEKPKFMVGLNRSFSEKNNLGKVCGIKKKVVYSKKKGVNSSLDRLYTRAFPLVRHQKDNQIFIKKIVLQENYFKFICSANPGSSNPLFKLRQQYNPHKSILEDSIRKQVRRDSRKLTNTQKIQDIKETKSRYDFLPVEPW